MKSSIVPSGLPVRPSDLTISEDEPSIGDARPFGLTRVEAADADMIAVNGITYDRSRQLNVDGRDQAVVNADRPIHAATHYDTKFDMTWVTDKD
ncbi:MULTISPECIES: hypothetical protein [Actinoalloteichus]|uniref:Uncharacterized protein n=1 Tax=Actinoalloteichus fjordicus TaxID=1612552 RepID=A0AAC9LHM7_9PSEU|nr:MULTISPECIES: hypothetical protein [Actinoalloteichus]APU16525.1 hypothetical protein UA74_22535 [Actinoalloteichus fjordicus]APU22593.1 hypothetical protein UA75_23055 [Actinoalloteichus sp. GBA129-24]